MLINEKDGIMSTLIILLEQNFQRKPCRIMVFETGSLFRPADAWGDMVPRTIFMTLIETA